jgi:hypothetical protein
VNGGTGNAGGWEPEYTVSVAQAAELVGAQFTHLRGAPVEALATGWDNTVCARRSSSTPSAPVVSGSLPRR